MNKKMLAIFISAGVISIAIIVFTVVFIINSQNKPVNITTTILTNELAYNLLEGYCGVGGEKANKYVLLKDINEAYIDLMNNETDIIFSYGVDTETLKWLENNKIEIETVPIGKDALVFINNTLNKVEDLTLEHLKGIYSGRITNWSELEGKDKEIIAYPALEKSEEEYMLKKFMGSKVIGKARYKLNNATFSKLCDALSSYLDTREKAIGYAAFYNTRQLPMQDNLRIISVDGVLPTEETIKNGEYPVAMNIYAVTKKDLPDNSQVKRLVEYILSKKGQDIVEESGHISLIQ